MYNNGESGFDERYEYRMQALRTLGTDLHSLQDVDGIIIEPHHTGTLFNRYDISIFDNPQYNIEKGDDGVYYAYDTENQYGSNRYASSVDWSRSYILAFYQNLVP